MSAPSIWEHMYFDTAHELDAMRSRLLQECHEERMRVIKLEGQRLTLLSHLRTAAKLLIPTFPVVAQRMLDVENELRNSYETPKPTVAELVTRQIGGVEESVSGHPGPARSAPVHAETGPTQQAPF
jgi:hypothetical protein